MELFTRRIYEHNGIAITVDIDFEKGTVTLVERMGNGTYQPKRWLFAEREQQYMAGWKAILEAMMHAIDEAKKLLEANDEDKLQKAINKFVELEMYDRKKGRKR